MKKTGQWAVVAAFVAAGVVGFACGGGGGETNPPNAGTASATGSSAPMDSSSAAPSATAAASTAATPTPPPPLTVAAMKLAIPKAKAPIELKDDGSVEVSKKTMMKFVGADLQDKDGKTVFSVAADGTVTGLPKSAKFDAKDALVIGDGAKMFIGDDGVVKLFNADGKADKDSGKIKYTGFKAPARRAATLLVMAAMMPAPPTPTAPKK